jgi:ABC-2 type transport system ATP-binding protein
MDAMPTIDETPDRESAPPPSSVSPSKRTAAITVKNLTHDFGSFRAVSDLSFEVGQGEVFGFIGPNGAGKTTTIRILSTLLEPTHGTVEICGVDASLEPEAVRRLIGYMPDHPGVYERVSVREFLDFFAAAAKVKQDVVDGVMDLTDLGPLADKMVTALSKGQKQRVQLARVLLHDPKVLILDEPASDLDPRARIEMRDLLVDLAKNGKTVFLSSHILTELAEVCTQVAILERGRLLACGPVATIGERIRGQAGETTRAKSRIRILGGPPKQAAELLSPLEGVVGVVPAKKDFVAFEYTGGDETLARAVSALCAAGVKVVGVEPERTELEEIFLTVTAGEQQ